MLPRGVMKGKGSIVKSLDRPARSFFFSVPLSYVTVKKALSPFL
jgi:hypothetical protein